MIDDLDELSHELKNGRLIKMQVRPDHVSSINQAIKKLIKSFTKQHKKCFKSKKILLVLYSLKKIPLPGFTAVLGKYNLCILLEF